MIVLILAIFAVTNTMIYSLDTTENGRPYRIEMERLAFVIQESGFENIDISNCEYVVHVEKSNDQNSDQISNLFFDTNSNYSVKEINGELYRFDYVYENQNGKKKLYL